MADRLFRSCLFISGPASTDIYTLSLHDALPISLGSLQRVERAVDLDGGQRARRELELAVLREIARVELPPPGDRKSTRLNSSHSQISYAVFCLKKKKTEYVLLKMNAPGAWLMRR